MTSGSELALTVGPVGGHGGSWVARHEGRVVFVWHALPGSGSARWSPRTAAVANAQADMVAVLEPRGRSCVAARRVLLTREDRVSSTAEGAVTTARPLRNLLAHMEPQTAAAALVDEFPWADVLLQQDRAQFAMISARYSTRPKTDHGAATQRPGGSRRRFLRSVLGAATPPALNDDMYPCRSPRWPLNSDKHPCRCSGQRSDSDKHPCGGVLRGVNSFAIWHGDDTGELFKRFPLAYDH